MTTPTQGEHAQPEALRLAECFEDNTSVVGAARIASELRRLHAENERLHAQVAGLTAAPQGGAYAELPEPDVRRLAIESGLIRKADSLRPTTWGRILRFAQAIQALRASHGQAPAATDWWRKRANEIEAQVAATGSTEAMRCYTDMRTLLQAATAQPAPAAHVQNPAEIEHVAGDVSKNRSESNMKGGAYAPMQGLSAYLRAEAVGVQGVAAETLRQWAAEVDVASAHALRASHGQAPAGEVKPDGSIDRNSVTGEFELDWGAQPATAASQKPLTDEQIDKLHGEANRGYCIEFEHYVKAVRDTEAAHGIKET